mgnify:CR=1 FL=1
MKEEEAFKLIRGLRNKLLKAEEVADEKLTRIDTALELVEIVIHCEECIIMGLEKSIVRVREDYSRLGGSKKIINRAKSKINIWLKEAEKNLQRAKLKKKELLQLRDVRCKSLKTTMNEVSKYDDQIISP